MDLHYRIAFLGFSDFERGALASYFRLAGKRTPQYGQVHMLSDADFLVADADHGPSVQLVVATERLQQTVFIGTQAPAGASVWMSRPIDALHVMRELDAMVMAGEQALAAAVGETPVVHALPPSPVTTRAAPALLQDALQDVLHAPSQDSLLERAAAAAPAAATPAAPAATPSSTPLLPRALIVDDSELAQRFLQSRLAPWDLLIDRASHSAQAIGLMRQHNYDLVFLDLELGPASELDGLALCQSIKRSPAAANTIVVIVSAHHSELDRVRGALAGCDAYLPKPLDAAEIERVLVRQGFKSPQKLAHASARRAASAVSAATAATAASSRAGPGA